jgi:hypothetical protein
VFFANAGTELQVESHGKTKVDTVLSRGLGCILRHFLRWTFGKVTFDMKRTKVGRRAIYYSNDRVILLIHSVLAATKCHYLYDCAICSSAFQRRPHDIGQQDRADICNFTDWNCRSFAPVSPVSEIGCFISNSYLLTSCCYQLTAAAVVLALGLSKETELIACVGNSSFVV